MSTYEEAYNIFNLIMNRIDKKQVSNIDITVSKTENGERSYSFSIYLKEESA